MKNSSVIFVAVISGVSFTGLGEFSENEILYVGLDYTKAKDILNNYDVSNDKYAGVVERWENGKRIEIETIYRS